MENNTPTGNAIIPEDPDRQLFLPQEMVQRGLDLAARVEQGPGTGSRPGKPTGKEYTVRCHLEGMAWARERDGSFTLGPSQQPLTDAPVYFVMSVEPEGVYITCAGQDLKIGGLEGNEGRFRLLNPRHDPDPFTISFPSLHLFYTLKRQVEEPAAQGLFGRIRREALKRLNSKTGPEGRWPPYQGPATREANPAFDSSRDCVQTVLLYIERQGNEILRQGPLSKDPPLKLTLVAIDPQGQEDPAGSRELYHDLLEAWEPGSVKRSYIRLEEVYHNMPSGTFQPDDWRGWERACAGKYLKLKGRAEGFTLHPQEKKAFFIITIAGEEVALPSPGTRVALWVEDARHMSLGEKEGSFLLDGKKWICLGNTYAFEGRVFQFSRFDPELAGTEFNNLVILKVKLADIQEA